MAPNDRNLFYKNEGTTYPSYTPEIERKGLTLPDPREFEDDQKPDERPTKPIESDD